MTQTPASVIARYNTMREAALADAQERLRARISIPFHIRSRSSTTPPSRHGRTNGGPALIVPAAGTGATLNRFEVAVWSGSILCGLAIGKPSKGPSRLALQLLEGNPADRHPLKGYIAECAVEAAISYGRLLGKTQLRLLRPLPGALPAYRKLNFKVESDSPEPPYCYMEI